jgi:hypothetical protein
VPHGRLFSFTFAARLEPHFGDRDPGEPRLDGCTVISAFAVIYE